MVETIQQGTREEAGQANAVPAAPAAPASHMGAGWSPGCSTLDPDFLLWPGQAVREA